MRVERTICAQSGELTKEDSQAGFFRVSPSSSRCRTCGKEGRSASAAGRTAGGVAAEQATRMPAAATRMNPLAIRIYLPISVAHRGGQNALDKVRLCLAVGVHIIRVLPGELALQARVSPSIVIVGPKPIAERQVPSKLVVVLSANVEVVTRPGAWRFNDWTRPPRTKRLPSRHVAIALVVVAEGGEPRPMTVGSTARLSITMSMSRTGLAARPGTEVLPTCSIRSASSPRQVEKTSRKATNWSAHAGSCSTTMTGPPIRHRIPCSAEVVNESETAPA